MTARTPPTVHCTPHISGVLDDGDLHAQADAQVRDTRGSGVGCCKDLSLNSSVTKTTRNQHAIRTLRGSEAEREDTRQ